MNAHERQQFDLLLYTAVDRFAERLVHRNEGAQRAHARLLATPEAEGVWLSEFVQALFRDALLDNSAGACFVLEALERRPLTAPPPTAPTVGETIQSLARAAFGTLLHQKTAEELARRAAFEGGPTES